MINSETISGDLHVKKFQKELNAGTISLILLAIMSKASDDLYGYQIAKQLEAVNDDEPIVKQSALYPVLRSMHASGLLSSHVVPSVTGPPRRYYAITQKGRESLTLWKSTWRRTSKLVESILRNPQKVIEK